MKLKYTAIALLLGMATATAYACPKGTHLTGGTGPHHKGGKCVAVSGTSAAMSKAGHAAGSKAARKHKHKAKKKTAPAK